ncbi:hypothetical protein WN943_025053 [Citrus x changshan-huyou]
MRVIRTLLFYMGVMWQTGNQPLPVAGATTAAAAAAAVSPSPSAIPREVQTVMGRRILNDALRAIVNAERRGKATVELQPISTVMSSFLNIMKYRAYFPGLSLHPDCIRKVVDERYIKDFQLYDPHRVGKIKVELLGRVNDCRGLTYRQDVKAREIEGYTVHALPTRQWGYVVITTPDGVLDHEEALRRNVGGQAAYARGNNKHLSTFDVAGTSTLALLIDNPQVLNLSVHYSEAEEDDEPVEVFCTMAAKNCKPSYTAYFLYFA